MKTDSKNTINIATEIATVIGSRDLIDNLKKVVKKVNAKRVYLDFSEVEFVSRSAAHALLLMKEDLKRNLFGKKEVVFINANSDVEKMLRIVAANLALPKRSKVDFKAERININSLSNESLDHSFYSCHK